MAKIPSTTEHVLKGVDLDIESGDFLTIVGRSGSGKTTLLNLIGALDTNYRGSIEVDGKKLGALSDRELSAYRNQRIGFVFQFFHLLEHMSCLENVMLPALFSRTSDAKRSDIEERAMEKLRAVDLVEKANVRPNNLSGGQKQRVAIARALLNDPTLMICDEPTGNLDRETGEEILRLFLRLNQEHQLTFVIVTHDHFVSDAASRVIRLENGKIVEDGRSQS